MGAFAAWRAGRSERRLQREQRLRELLEPPSSEQQDQAREVARREAEFATRMAQEGPEDRLRRLAEAWNARDRNRAVDDLPRVMDQTAWRRHRDSFASLVANWPGEPVLLWAEPAVGSKNRMWTRMAVLGLPRQRHATTAAAANRHIACGVQMAVPDRSYCGDPWSPGNVTYSGSMPREPRGEIVNISPHVNYWGSSPIAAPAGTLAGDAIWTMDLLIDLVENRNRFGSLQARLDKNDNIQLETIPADPAQPPRTRRRPRPTPRLVRDAAEAEEMAAEWVRWLGWAHAKRTPATADGGIDVLGRNARSTSKVAAQVKFEALPTGRPILQGLYGAGHGEGADTWLFFSSAGYTAQAQEWAGKVGMALFRFTLDGGIEGINPRARELLQHPRAGR